MTATTSLTASTISLFVELVNDAPNWSGNPLLDITKEQRGNLTQLKQAGVVETFKADGDQWVRFTEAGMLMAEQMGLDSLREYGTNG
jgi:hypothetical protein